MLDNQEDGFSWKNFHVSHNKVGAPTLSVLRDDGEILGDGKLTISHDGEYLVAMVVLPDIFEKRTPPSIKFG